VLRLRGGSSQGVRFAALQARGPGAKRNFPEEVINELPETVGEKQSVTPVSSGRDHKGRKLKGQDHSLLLHPRVREQVTCKCSLHRPTPHCSRL
jgi:hypothetical protein